jgi:hypothetical protein
MKTMKKTMGTRRTMMMMMSKIMGKKCHMITIISGSISLNSPQRSQMKSFSRNRKRTIPQIVIDRSRCLRKTVLDLSPSNF